MQQLYTKRFFPRSIVHNLKLKLYLDSLQCFLPNTRLVNTDFTPLHFLARYSKYWPDNETFRPKIAVGFAPKKILRIENTCRASCRWLEGGGRYQFHKIKYHDTQKKFLGHCLADQFVSQLTAFVRRLVIYL